MKKIILFSSLIAVVVVGYLLLGPFFTMRSIWRAANDGDVVALREVVDFQSIRESLKDQLNTEMAVRGADNNTELGAFAPFGVMLASKITDGMVDQIVSPQALITQIKNVDTSSNAGQKLQMPATQNVMSLRLSKYFSCFSNINLFRLKVLSSDSELIFRREGVSWRLVDIRVRELNVDRGVRDSVAKSIRGKYSDVAVRNDEVFSRFPSSLKRDKQMFSERLSTVVPVREADLYWVGSGCKAHECGGEDAAWAVDQADGRGYAIIATENGKKFLLHGFDVTDIPKPLSDWAADLSYKITEANSVQISDGPLAVFERFSLDGVIKKPSRPPYNEAADLQEAGGHVDRAGQNAPANLASRSEGASVSDQNEAVEKSSGKLVTVSTEQLRSEFIENESAAKKQYEGMRLKVFGIVRSVRRKDERALIQFTGVEAIMRTGMEGDVASYRSGQKVDLMCNLEESPNVWLRLGDCITVVHDADKEASSHATTSLSKAPLHITAAQYYSDYHDNGVFAEEKYKDRVLYVSGVVRLVGSFSDQRVYVSLYADNHDFAAVEAILRSDMYEKSAAFTQGQQLSLVCLGGQKKIGQWERPVLSDCHD